MRKKCEQEIRRFLREAGLHFSKLSNVPQPTIGRMVHELIPNLRSSCLSQTLEKDFFHQPVLKEMLCTNIGFQGPFPWHYVSRPTGHEDHILIVCADNQGWVELDGTEWTIHKNEAFLIPRHTPHAYGCDPKNPWANYWIHFQGRQGDEFVNLITADTPSPVIHLHRNEEVVACIEQVYQYMSYTHAYPELVAASGAMSQLLGLIHLRMRTYPIRGRTAEDGIDKTIEFMHKNLARKLSLDDLANVAGMSSNHYGQSFSKLHRRTPINYFNCLKIQKAGELLKNTHFRISEIGAMVGFPDSYYFSRLFKKFTGLSPRAYRE